MRHRALLFAFALGLLGLAACDPPGPGAAGTITLPDGVSTSGYTHIEVRAFAREGAAFDVNAVLPGEYDVPSTEVAIDAPGPWLYEASYGMGGTEDEHWRVVAWLAGDDAIDSARIPPGAPYGTRDFDIAGCGIFGPDYCGTTQGVDLVLDQRAPSSD